MIIITGIHKSGINIVSNLLSICTESLENTSPLYNKNNQIQNDNRNQIAMSINKTILKFAGGNWCNPPSEQQIASVGKRLGHFIKKFSEIFKDGIVKDSLLNLTISLWEKYCNNITSIIFCLRNPIDVALSLQHQNGLSIETGLQLWYVYTIRFIKGTVKIPVVVVDFDNIISNVGYEMDHLLTELGVSMLPQDLNYCNKELEKNHLNKYRQSTKLIEKLPEEIKKLYTLIRSQTFMYRESPLVV